MAQDQQMPLNLQDQDGVAPQGGPLVAPVGAQPIIQPLAPSVQAQQPFVLPPVGGLPGQAPENQQVQAQAAAQVPVQQVAPMQVEPQQAQVAPQQVPAAPVPVQQPLNYQQALVGQAQPIPVAGGNQAMAPPLLAPQPQVQATVVRTAPIAPPMRDMEQVEVEKANRLAQQAIAQAGVANLGPQQVQGLIDQLMAMQLSRASAPQTPTRPHGEGTSVMATMTQSNDIMAHLLSAIQDLGLRVNSMQSHMQAAAVERTPEVVFQQSTPPVVATPVRQAQKYSPQKPSFLSMGFDEATEGRNLSDIKNVWLFSFRNFRSTHWCS